MDNSQIAEVFENIAALLQMKGETVFTVRAYQRAARTIDRLATQLDQMVRDEQDLTEIPGIGKAISGKIRELAETGSLGYYEKLKQEFPDGFLELMQVPGIGPKTVMRLWKELDITTLAALERGIENGSVAALPRLGKKAADNILRHLNMARSKDQRYPVGRALRISERLVGALKEQCPSLIRMAVAGSLRRFEETIGDIDLVCTAGDPQQVLDALVSQPNVAEVLAHGGTKASIVTDEGIQVDLRVVDDSRFGSLLQYFTGSQQHNIRLREHAQKMGLSLNEYGITTSKSSQVEEFAEEDRLYARLGLQYVPPELRLGMYEFEPARGKQLPDLVQVSDIRGDLHVHTDWSDGRDAMELMVAAAKERGLEYVAITDHSSGRGIANGLSVDRLRSQIAQVREVEARIGGIRVLCGMEMDIRADGSLDYPDDVLQDLDWVIGSIHSAMGQDSARMTERIVMAMRNPHVAVIGHLSTRLIGQRPPISCDFEAVFRAAAETGTALEINASPERLDLKDSHVYRARQLGVPLVISTDAHTSETLDNTRFGVAVARRGWCEAKNILNTRPVSKFLSFLRMEKSLRANAFASHE